MPSSKGPKIIWIDLDNSPHVPFFIPIIEELKKRGYSVFLTARDAYQVVELVELHHLDCKRIGRNYGKFKIMKVMGVCFRAFQLMRIARKQDLALALSHGSRSQIIAATLLRIPTVLIFDYEHAKRSRAVNPTWTMRPEVIYPDGDPYYSKRALKYPGLKEDVYVPRFRPDPGPYQSIQVIHCLRAWPRSGALSATLIRTSIEEHDVLNQRLFGHVY